MQVWTHVCWVRFARRIRIQILMLSLSVQTFVNSGLTTLAASVCPIGLLVVTQQGTACYAASVHFSLLSDPVWGWGTPFPPLLLPCPFTSSSFALYYFFPFSFSHLLYLFSSIVHSIPVYQNRPAPFPGVRSYEATEPGFSLFCLWLCFLIYYLTLSALDIA